MGDEEYELVRTSAETFWEALRPLFESQKATWSGEGEEAYDVVVEKVRTNLAALCLSAVSVGASPVLQQLTWHRASDGEQGDMVFYFVLPDLPMEELSIEALLGMGIKPAVIFRKSDVTGAGLPRKVTVSSPKTRVLH